MIKYGMPGVWTHAFVDMWYPGYIGLHGLEPQRHAADVRDVRQRRRQHHEARDRGRRRGRHGRGRRTDVRASGTGRSRRTPRSSGRSATTRTTCRRACCRRSQLTAAFPKVVLENFYRKSRNSIEAGKKEAPFGYVIPAGQRDTTRVAWLVNLLRMQGIEVGRATAEVKLKEGTFPAGSFIVKRDQPYGRLAKILLEKQDFPDPEPPHLRRHRLDDGAADETDVKEIADKAVLDVAGRTGRRRWSWRAPSPGASGDRHGRRARRLGQHDHPALPAEGPVRCRPPSGPFKAGGSEYPGGFVGRRRPGVPADARGRRPRSTELGLTAAVCRRCRPCRCTTSTCRAWPCSARGAARRTWVGTARVRPVRGRRTTSSTRSG